MNRIRLWERAGRGVQFLLPALMLVLGGRMARAQALPQFDFARSKGASEWVATHDVAAIKGSQEGMVIEIKGDDPYIQGPARDYPVGQPLWLRVRLKSEQGGTAQVFYFEKDTTEANSVKFAARPGVWEEARLPLPPLGPHFHLRLDPPGTGGKCVVALMAFEPRHLLKEPVWPKPEAPVLQDERFKVESGDLQIVSASPLWNDFVIRVGGRTVGNGHTHPFIGTVENGQVHWLDVTEKARKTSGFLRGKEVLNNETFSDGAAVWEIRQKFAPAALSGAIDIETQITVSQDRLVVYLPVLEILPGVGAFGEKKEHGLFAGLEYLDADEPSSSEADIIGPGSHRQVPDSLRITFPLMAVQAEGRYVGLTWQPDSAFSALYDSPDRLFHSGGHLMGVIYPGTDGNNRVEGSLLPYEGQLLQAGKPLTLRATLLGGKGRNITDIVQQYVALRGLPTIPHTGKDRQEVFSLAASGWLDSGLGEGGRYRHALPGSFKAQPAADAALMMDWLAREIKDQALAGRLRTAAQKAISRVAADDFNFGGVSHVRYPAPALFYGPVEENAAHAERSGRDLLRRFAPDGSVPFRKSPDGLDYGKTHFAPDANGLTGQVVMSVLEAATVSGNPDLIREGLRVLRALDKFAGSAPRGAQTWEVPLHTPDILASAHLVRAYLLGYQLTGEAHLLEQARYWAWTGVPFVYLASPVTASVRAYPSLSVAKPVEKGKQADPVGLYATTAVFGATQWISPDWMGLPVQWCGLVYSDALYRLFKEDPNPLWKQLADGITASGIQQTWPKNSNALRQGLLPDSFNLRPQTRNDAAINPGTLLANAIQYLGGPSLYDFKAFRASGLLVHAPGAIREAKEEAGKITFTAEGWSDKPYQLLIVGLKKEPQVTVNGKTVSLAAPHKFLPESGRLILRVEGKPRVEITY